MTLKPLAVRVPAKVKEEIDEIVEKEKLDKATVVRNLLEVGIMSGENRLHWTFCRRAK